MDLQNLDYKSIAEKIISLQDADIAVRDKLAKNGQLNDGYNAEMRRLHNSNAKVLSEIMDVIGYPTIEKVGTEANAAAWLVVQHAIDQPVFMKKCAKLLQKAVSEQQADAKHLAYLTDRIAVFKGNPQLYGTQFDWDENGELSPNPFDNLDKVNERRKSIGLNTIEDQTAMIRTHAKNEHQSPPGNFEERKQEIANWKKNVGWIR